jgi:kinetochore protein Mis13/DSN1
VEYEEDIEGFQFSRAGQVKRSRSSDKGTDAESSAEETPLPQPVAKPRGKGRPPKNATSPKKTAATAPTNGKSTQATLVHRRSKRRAEDEGSTTPPAKQSKSRGQLDDSRPATINIPKKRGPRRKSADADTQQPEAEDNETPATHTRHAATKVALPLADTPVIRRNREMRQEKSKKGQRRSSLSMRGRRASSLIESGASNGESTFIVIVALRPVGVLSLIHPYPIALPHDAVDSAHFYKHIEGDGLPEPRRMKQLLTWCATRALGEKPSGSRSEDESARLAGEKASINDTDILYADTSRVIARVIQEELLKDLGNRSELSDWFGRRETTPPAVVVKKPNPKNVQNAQKLKELEAQIRRYVIHDLESQV